LKEVLVHARVQNGLFHRFLGIVGGRVYEQVLVNDLALDVIVEKHADGRRRLHYQRSPDDVFLHWVALGIEQSNPDV
jgi:hypothetical protein